MNKDIRYLSVILRERLRRHTDKDFKENEHFANDKFFIKFMGIKYFEEKDNWYEAEMRAGIPETCAVQIYLGKADTPDEAFENLKENVLRNNPIPIELG